MEDKITIVSHLWTPNRSDSCLSCITLTAQGSSVAFESKENTNIKFSFTMSTYTDALGMQPVSRTEPSSLTRWALHTPSLFSKSVSTTWYSAPSSSCNSPLTYSRSTRWATLFEIKERATKNQKKLQQEFILHSYMY